ncbi:MAG: N-acetyl-gamma-glutamyl-phosphate reductase [Chloroflexota bacterium]
MVARVGILNVTGYGGLAAAALVAGHPEMELAAVTARSQAGSSLRGVFPFWDGPDLVLDEALGSTHDLDLVLSALPHASSAATLAPLLRAGCRAVDISADFRLPDAAEYERWYGGAHPAPDLLGCAVYGLPELSRERIREALLVANPGCHATAAILALAPAVAAGLIGEGVVVDTKTGVSGGGRSLTLANHYSEVNESVSGYGLTGHRHLPEIVGALAGLAEAAGAATPRVTFVPHLVPMTRGLLATCYADLQPGVGAHEVKDAYERFYAGHPWTRVLDMAPQTKWTSGTNLCLVHATVDETAGRLVVLSAIDNLMKGASGQAIQNANIMLGLPEVLGLPGRPTYP